MTHASAQMTEENDGKKLKGWHVLVIMMAFFGVMFSVNGVFLYHAITSFPGEDIKKSYVQGLNYNDTLAARASQATLGWQAEAGVQGDEIIVRLRDADGLPLTHRSMVGELRRLATRDGDRAVVFQTRSGGEYVAPVSALAPGQWLLRVSVLDADTDEIVFNLEKTLIVS